MPLLTKTSTRPVANTSDGIYSLIAPPQVLTSSDVMGGLELWREQRLWLFNPTGGTLNILIQASAGVAAQIFEDGTGPRLNADDGITIAIAPAQCRVIPIDTVFRHLDTASPVNITGGTGCFYALIEPYRTGVTQHV